MQTRTFQFLFHYWMAGAISVENKLKFISRKKNREEQNRFIFRGTSKTEWYDMGLWHCVFGEMLERRIHRPNIKEFFSFWRRKNELNWSRLKADWMNDAEPLRFVCKLNRIFLPPQRHWIYIQKARTFSLFIAFCCCWCCCWIFLFNLLANYWL